MPTPTRLSVLGAGSWGTVLAHLLASNGHQVMLWTRTADQAQRINEEHRNTAYMPQLSLVEGITATAKLSEAVAHTAAVIWAIPTKATHQVMPDLPRVPAFISCSKGLAKGSFATVTSQLQEYQPEALMAALSGPNLAKEIARRQPAAATLASDDMQFAKVAQGWFNQPYFRVYTSSDLKGLEVAGAMKNVIALAAGMSDGLALGDNAKATLLTRGLAEMIRLGKHLGGLRETFYGLAGLGDMIATCASTNSRNYTVGQHVATGKSLAEIQSMNITAEGLATVEAIYHYADIHQLELPISQEIYQVIYHHKEPLKALQALMEREPRAES